MTIYFCDIECDGLLEDVTKVHCLSVKPLNGAVSTYIGYYDSFMRLLKADDTLVWHNGFGYDIPVLEKFDITIPKDVQIIDTLALSREWWPDNPAGHGLAAWAKRLGTFKPEIKDWHNLPLREYTYRCENDVITTEKVFVFLADKLGIEYD